MITLNKESLIITMHETSAIERKDWLIKALAASMRWKACATQNGEAWDDDEQHQIVLAELINELIDIKKD